MKRSVFRNIYAAALILLCALMPGAGCIDDVNGDGEAPGSKVPFADAPVGCEGPFTLEHQQPIACLPFPNSLWNRPLPQTVLSHRRADSEAIIDALFTQDGKYHYPWTRPQGIASIVPTSSKGRDGSPPLYYGGAKDPVYVVKSARHPVAGANSPIGRPFHAPNGATFNFSRADNYINVWDQTTNQVLSSYIFYRGTWSKFPVCPGNGHAGTVADPCPVSDLGYAGMSNWWNDKGWGTAASDSLPNGGWATHIRAQEIMQGPIPHALFLFSDCMAGTVFPANNSGVTRCPDGVKRAPLGALFFLDYTPAQLQDMKARIPLWQHRIIEALTVYGGYFGEASLDHFGGPSIPTVQRFEGPAAYNLAGIAYPFYDWLTSFPHDPSNGDKSQSLACYTYGQFTGCDLNAYVGIPLYTGPNCPDTTCDVSRHMHIAHECVALGLAGQPGGCN